MVEDRPGRRVLGDIEYAHLPGDAVYRDARQRRAKGKDQPRIALEIVGGGKRELRLGARQFVRSERLREITATDREFREEARSLLGVSE